MSANAVAATLDLEPFNDEVRPVVRFLRGPHLLGQTPFVAGMTLVEHAVEAGVEIPTNCSSGTCGACIGFLKWKIQRKLNEVEIRQRHHLHLKRPSAQSSEQETSED